MYDDEPMMAKPMKPGTPKLRVSATMIDSTFMGGDKSYLKERHTRLKKEIAAAEKEIANWDAEAVAAQALKALKTDLARLRADLLSCEAEMGDGEDADEEAPDTEDADEESDDGDSEDSEDGSVVAEGNPYTVYKRGGKFVIENNETGKVKGSHATKAKAMKQFKLLEGIEHGWEPSED